MAISRRLRFEILRRDGHACRYCGAMAPDVKLTVDHVIPVALGGSDDPTNLVTACADCNAGKTSTQPDSELVADVAADALRWKRALEAAASNLLAEREVVDGLLDRFEQTWSAWTFEVQVAVPPELAEPTGDVLVDNWHRLIGGWMSHRSRPAGFADGVLKVQVERGYLTETRRELNRADTKRQLRELLGHQDVTRVEVVDGWPGPLPAPPRASTKTERQPVAVLPPGWRNSIERFISLGLPEQELHRFVRVAMERRGIASGERFRFFCGCCWRALTDLQEDARRFIEMEP